ncbi:MAG: hypothetical protein K2P89_13655 [Lachnospiraceae bacterium]|nr:hypothetical protein [Lachnospiraceae bacterium]
MPSQTPSQTVPETTPSGKPQNGTSNSTQTGNVGGTETGTQNKTPGETPNSSTGETGTGTQNSTSSAGTSSAQNLYVPGIYSSTLLLGNANVELQVAVDKNHINSITLTNLDESITTLYPLMSPTLSELASVILSEQSIDNISYGTENRYTSMLLMQAITEALDKAAASENADRPETGVIY